MKSNLPSKNTVKLGSSGGSIEVYGKNADMIATATTAMLLLFGIAAILKSIR